MQNREIHVTIFLLFSLVFFSCQENDLDCDVQNIESGESRALYDNGYVEWDNTYYLSYKLDNDDLKTDLLPVPWASGSSHSMGIPDDWFDRNLTDSDSSKRAYSHANGWEMVYSNLLEKGASNKYFALYNKYTGKLRMFFYALNASSSSNNSATFAGFQVKGSSILNFTYSDPQPMSYEPSVATYVFAPKCNFAAANSGGSDLLPGVTYAGNNWYGLELECAYDETTSVTNSLAIKLWAANITITQSEGEAIGDITGNISTTYSNVPSFDLALNINHSVSVTETVNNGGIILGDKVANKIQSGDSFFGRLWNKIKTELPSIATKGIEEGIKSLLTGGASTLTELGGRLVNSILGLGDTETMTSLSEVKLKSNATISLDASSTTAAPGWGEIKDLPLPGYGGSLALYNKKLGVWNIRTTPTIKVDMNTTSWFNNSGVAPAAIIIGQVPVDWEARFNMLLQPIDLVVNPEVLDEFTLYNLKTDIVFTNGLNGVSFSQPYGLYNDLQLYMGVTTNGVPTVESHGVIELNGYNAETSFEQSWLNKLEEISNHVYCRISFELRHKTSSKVIGFSKYFRVNAVKGTHSHVDTYINN